MGKIIAKNVVDRRSGYLYYVDGKGHVCEAKMARGGKKKKAAKKKSATKRRRKNNPFRATRKLNLFLLLQFYIFITQNTINQVPLSFLY